MTRQDEIDAAFAESQSERFPFVLSFSVLKANHKCNRLERMILLCKG